MGKCYVSLLLSDKTKVIEANEETNTLCVKLWQVVSAERLSMKHQIKDYVWIKCSMDKTSNKRLWVNQVLDVWNYGKL